MEGLLKHGSLDPTPRVSESVGLGRILSIDLSKFPGDAATPGSGTTPVETVHH